MNTYALLKFLHIVSSTLLFGTGMGTAFFMWMGHRSGDIAVIARTAHITVLADWLFTTPAVIVQPVTGVLLMQAAGFSLRNSWLSIAIVLYGVAGACWLPVVALHCACARSANAHCAKVSRCHHNTSAACAGGSRWAARPLPPCSRRSG